jgi:hypothetical protein
LLVLAGIGVASTVLAADLSKFPASTKTDVTYEKDIAPILKDNCVKCHSGAKARAGLSLDSLDGALKGSKDGKVIIPGKSADSSLVVAIARVDPDNAAAMPPIRKPRAGAAGDTATPPAGPPQPTPLTAEQVGLFRAWIDQGAK